MSNFWVVFKSWKDVDFLHYSSKSIEIMTFIPILLLWWMSLSSFHQLNNPWIPGINLTWLWCTMFLMCHWNQFTSCLGVSIAITQHRDQKQLGKKKGFPFSHHRALATEVKAGRKSGQEHQAGTWRQELEQKQWRNTLVCSSGLQSALSHYSGQPAQHWHRPQ